jgi:exodeoxyribonuclease VII small subunit
MPVLVICQVSFAMPASIGTETAMPEDSELHFEAAVRQLEEIVEALEHGEPELATALSKYETGVRLLTQCYSLLERAERSVALLTGVDDQGNPIAAPFDATATIQRESRQNPGWTDSSGETSPAPAPKSARARRTKPMADKQPDPFEPPF